MAVRQRCSCQFCRPILRSVLLCINSSAQRFRAEACHRAPWGCQCCVPEVPPGEATRCLGMSDKELIVDVWVAQYISWAS